MPNEAEAYGTVRTCEPGIMYGICMELLIGHTFEYGQSGARTVAPYISAQLLRYNFRYYLFTDTFLYRRQRYISITSIQKYHIYHSA